MRSRTDHGSREPDRVTKRSSGILHTRREKTVAVERAERVTLRATVRISQASSAAEWPSPTTTVSRPANGSGVR
jgi:hypothetical protein